MGDLGGRVEYDCIIVVTVRLMEEWWTMESGRRRENYFAITVVSETVTRRGLEQVVNVS